MNILNLLTKEKRVAGVEISDRVIRIAYFLPKKKSGKKIHESHENIGHVDVNIAKLPKESLPKSSLDPQEHELVLIEEPISADIIREGVVINKELLGKTLRDIWTKTKLSADYAIVAIPENKVYSQIFNFPRTSDESQVKEAVNLAIDFQLPVARSDVYIGWEKSPDPGAQNEVLISTISKSVANGYIDALNSAGIKILALESHLASIGRAIKLDSGQTTLLTKKNEVGATVFILENGMVHFSRTLGATFVKENGLLINEVSHIKTSFESERKTPIVEIPLTEAVIKDEYLEYPELNKLTPGLQIKWLIAIGAAIRGEITEGQDNHISLLPVGTAEAYAYQKTTTFIKLVRNMTIGVSIFFLFTFSAAYFFIFYLSQKANATNSNISGSSISPDLLQKEAWIKNINDMTAATATILSTTPTWSILLDEINSRVITGVLISNFTVTSINDPITMTGTAKDRDTLNKFKKSLQASEYLTTVELPITNLEQKGDIPFSISFLIKDPSMLYYK